MKTKVTKVLIAMDYNPTAQTVAEAGYRFAKSMDAAITLLHVISDPVYYYSVEYSPIMGFNGFIDPGLVQRKDVHNLKKAALEFLYKSRNHLGDESITTMVAEGDFAESIMETAKSIGADIIVLGSHSRKWLENILTGSVTEYLIRHSRIPLLIIPTKKVK
jgi:nucleotide-binding universal stress UspA family protein